MVAISPKYVGATTPPRPQAKPMMTRPKMNWTWWKARPRTIEPRMYTTLERKRVLMRPYLFCRLPPIRLPANAPKQYEPIAKPQRRSENRKQLGNPCWMVKGAWGPQSPPRPRMADSGMLGEPITYPIESDVRHATTPQKTMCRGRVVSVRESIDCGGVGREGT